MAIATLMAACRAGIGLATMVAPRLSGHVLFADADLRRSSHVALRMFGVRDVAMGVGALVAARRGPGAVRGWVQAGAFADAADVVTMLRDGSGVRGAARLLTVMSAGSAAATAWFALRGLPAD